MRMLSLRLDAKTEKELDYIKSILNESQTLVIKEAIHAYYEILVSAESHKSAGDIFMDSGYIGSFKAEKNLSINYKEKLTKGLKRKHGIK
jgi:hypothetical protein